MTKTNYNNKNNGKNNNKIFSPKKKYNFNKIHEEYLIMVACYVLLYENR